MGRWLTGFVIAMYRYSSSNYYKHVFFCFFFLVLSCHADLEQVLPTSTITKLSRRFAVKPLQPLLCSESRLPANVVCKFVLVMLFYLQNMFKLFSSFCWLALCPWEARGCTCFHLHGSWRSHLHHFAHTTGGLKTQQIKCYYQVKIICRKTFIIFKSGRCLFPWDLQLQALALSDKMR